MESTDSSAGSPRQHQPNLPPGFRFHPTDEELVVHYLKKKAVSAPLPVSIIAEVDLYKFDPWELPAKATFGEQEWYFFSPRDRKYPNGARPNRAATSGYWKATGTDKPVLTSGGTQKVGVKKALVFYGGKPPKGIKTNWIMHEYRLADNRPNNRPPGYHDPANKKNSLRLDDWVLCRIYKKANASRPLDHHHHPHPHPHPHPHHDSIMSDDMFEGPTNSNGNSSHHHHQLMTMMTVLAPQNISKLPKSAALMSYGAAGMSDNDHHQLFDGMLSSTSNPAAANNDDVTDNNNNNAKRAAALPGMYWGSVADDAGPSKPDHHHQHNESVTSTEYAAAAETDPGNAAASSSLASLLSQPALHHGQQSMLGALGDGIFQRPFPLPGMNWYS